MLKKEEAEFTIQYSDYWMTIGECCTIQIWIKHPYSIVFVTVQCYQNSCNNNLNTLNSTTKCKNGIISQMPWNTEILLKYFVHIAVYLGHECEV